MHKKVYIEENNLMKIKRFMTGENTSHKSFVDNSEPTYEKDEYTIGGEGSNNDFFHINESRHADLDYINSLSYTIETDEDGNEYYDGEVYDMDGNHLDFFYGDKDDIEYYFQDNLNIAEKIFNKDAMKRGNFYWIEDIQYELVNEMNVDINNVEDVNKAAKKISKPGGESLFILTDGSIIGFYDHAEIQSVCDGMTISKFLELGNIRCGISINGNTCSIELIKQPTLEQRHALEEFIGDGRRYVYLDFSKPNSNNNMYPENIFDTVYTWPNPKRVVNDITNYFIEGIKPVNEGKEEGNNIANENTFEKWFGNSILKDEDGKPLKMYHGTDAEFSAFSKEHIGKIGSYEGYGFNFTPYYSRAVSYNSKNVIEAYLRVENPMTTNDNKISLRDLVKIISELDEGKPYTDTIVAAYEPAGYKEKWDEKYYLRALPVAAKTIYQYNKENEYGDAGIYAEICICGNADKIKVIDVFEKLGYDSAIFYNDGKINTVVVFEPNQIKLTTNKTFNNDSEVMGENVETEVEASEVNLDSFKKKETLAPRIWDGFNLNPKVRLRLLDIADDFWEFTNINWVKRKGIHLTGSICNYNWSKFSDIDLHIVVDFSEIDDRKDFVQEYFNSKKNEWNNEHSKLKIYGYQVELYVEDVDAETMSGGLYDLEDNSWIKKPSEEGIKPIGLDKYEIKNKSAKLMTLIDDLQDEFNSTDDDAKLREIGNKAHRLLNRIKRMRKFGLSRGGESDPLNITFKVLRRSGYIEMLWGLSAELYDKLKSIGINESLIKEDFDLFGAAKKYFGTTNDLRECGFILPDGSMLDLSGRHNGAEESVISGRRTVCHRSVEKLENENTPYITLSRFVEAGAIRCDLRGAFINLIKRPTKEQISILSRFITRLNGHVQLEIGDDDISIDYIEYDGVNYKRIINDILNFFDNRVKPSSLYESIKRPISLNEEAVADCDYNTIIKHIAEEINKKKLFTEEYVADGSANHNPFKERWKREREALKNYLVNYGEIMTSKENGKQYKVLYDSSLSSKLGINYCICIQWNQLTMEPGEIIYVRAFDKFTRRLFKPEFDTRGFDNIAGNADDVQTY